jgi:hypothetical protein
MGRFPVGLNGTVVSIPHSEQSTCVSTLTPLTPDVCIACTASVMIESLVTEELLFGS